MAVSLNLPTLPNLYCNEAASEVVSWESDECECQFVAFATSGFSMDFDDDSIINMFDSEVDQMLEFKSLSRFYDLPDMVAARQESVQWILKVHSVYRFRPEVAYLSVNYLDRFLSARALLQGKGKEWPAQLLSVACLSLAAKMEEANVPFLLDLQILKPRFLFKPKTIQRMELLVMNTLKWRLRTITPFEFVHYFIARVLCINNSHQNSLSHIISCASDLIVHTCKAIDSLDYPPSAIAAAVALWLTNHNVDDQSLGCLQDRVNKEMVKKMYNMIQRKMSLSPHIKQQKLKEPLPPSPTGVLDAACFPMKLQTEEDLHHE